MIWLLFFGFVIGTILGSFAKAVADRQQKQNSLRGRSYCMSCKHNLAWYDLFPVFSYLILLGKCRYCHKKIPIGNLLAELIMGLLITLLFVIQPVDIRLLLNPSLQSGIYILEIIFEVFLITTFFILFLTDLKTGLLPDKITYPSIFITIFYLLSVTSLKSWLLYESLKVNLIGKYFLPPYSGYVWTLIYRLWEPMLYGVLTGALASLFFAVLIIITRGKGMGWGDVKFVLFLGLALGFPNGVVAVFLAFLSGAIFSLVLLALGKKHFGQTIPFGPFLSLGAFIALLWGSQILNWYLNSFRLEY